MQPRKGDVSLNDYRIFETDEFIKKINKLTPQDKSFILNKLQSYVYPPIKKEPWFGKNIKKVKSYEPETWRYRIGKFRLFYIIGKDRIIYILTLDLRKDAY